MGSKSSKDWGEGEEHTMTPNEIMRKAKTGDLILFQGQGLDARLIRCASVSNEWSHVGVVIEYENEKLITEAYPIIIDVDVLRGTRHKGVQFVGLRNRLLTYPSGRLAYRPLIGKVDPKRVDNLVKTYRSLKDNEIPQYNKNWWDFIEYGTRTDDDDNIYKNVKHYVCTSWAAEIMMELDVCDKTVEAGNYMLSDFGMTYRPIPTTNKGYSFGLINYKI